MKGTQIFIHLIYAIIITTVNSARSPANAAKGLLDCDLTCEDVTKKIKSLEDNFAIMRRTIIDLVKQNKKISNLENSIEMKLENITSNFERGTEALRHKLEEEVRKRMDLQDTVDTLQETLNQTQSQLLESKGTVKPDEAKDIPKIIKKIPGACYLQDLPEKEGVDLNGDEPVNSNEKAHIVCHKGYVLKYPDVFCILGEWLTENNLSPCQKTSGCYLKDLPEKEGVDLNGDEPVNSNEKAHIVCFKGYVLKYPDVSCVLGEWLTENNLSPCQKNNILPQTCSLRDLAEKDGVDLTADKPVISNRKADIVCEKGYILAFPNVFCSRGTLLTENVFSPCQPESCSLRDLPENDGVDLTEDKLVNSDEKADIVCQNGYRLSFPNVYCIRGTWLLENDLSPCQPESCSLGDLPEKDGVVLTEDELVNSDEKAVIVCEEGYSLDFPNVYCIRGKWLTENNLSPCQADNCSLRDLPENNGVVLTEDELVNSGDKADITCEKGYSLAFPNVHCIRGKWITENDLSPCQEDSCEVQPIENAEIKENVLLGNKPGLQKGAKSKYLKVEIGSFQKSGDSLFVNCVDGYGFADANVVLVKITCNRGQWTPVPECELLPTCNIGVLHDYLSEGVVPYVEEGMSEDISYGRSVKLGCYKSGMILKGDIFANCSADGEWKIGNNVQCAQGCASYERKLGSELLLFPDKQFYEIGESILFSCPEGKTLTKRVDKVLCSKQGWAPNVKPECF